MKRWVAITLLLAIALLGNVYAPKLQRKWVALQRTNRTVVAVPARQTDPVAAIGSFDVRQSDLRVDGLTYITGWALHESGIQSATLIVDEDRRLPLNVGVKRDDVAVIYKTLPDAQQAGFEGLYDFGTALRGEHQFEVELMLRNGNVAKLGPWKFAVDAKALAYPKSIQNLGTQRFFVNVATSNLSRGGADELRDTFKRYESNTVRTGVTVPILYLRTTLGAAKDWQFDPGFDITRMCGERHLAEDNLNDALAWAVKTQTPILITLNGGVWADAACDVPEWDVNDAMEKNIAHVQWNEKNEAMPDDYFKSRDKSAPEIARVISYNIYNEKPRAYKKRNLQAAARVVKQFADTHPDLFVGVNVDSDTYTSPFFEGAQWYDFNPNTLKQFREWLALTGPYATNFRAATIPNLRYATRHKAMSLAEVNALSGGNAKTWDEVDAPRTFSATVNPYWESPWHAKWEQFRRHLVDVHYDELSTWINEVGIAQGKIFSSQGFTPPRPPINPFAIKIDSPAKNYDTGGMSVEGAVPSHGNLGAVLYGDSSRNAIDTEDKRPLFSIFRALSEKWAVVEFHPADIRDPAKVPNFANSYASLREMYRGGAQFVSIMAWNGGSGKFRGQAGFIAITTIRDTPLEIAIKQFMVNHAGLPKGSIVWTFGSLVVVDDEGWKTTIGVGNAEYGRYRLKTDAQGHAEMRQMSMHTLPPHTYTGLSLQAKAGSAKRVTIYAISPGKRTMLATAELTPNVANTLWLPFTTPTLIAESLAIEFNGAAAQESIEIERIALLPQS